MGMFAIGEAVLYGSQGICTVEGIEEMKVGRTKARYFVLRPVYRNSSTVFVPADNEQLLQKMRPVLSKEALHALLREAAQTELQWIDDIAQRKVAFQAILAEGERTQLLQMLQLLYLHRQALHQRGKHLRTADDQLLRDGEKLIHDEFAYVLQIPQQQVNEYIRNYLQQSME
jgi:CarD family transcriptional regulator